MPAAHLDEIEIDGGERILWQYPFSFSPMIHRPSSSRVRSKGLGYSDEESPVGSGSTLYSAHALKGKEEEGHPSPRKVSGRRRGEERSSPIR